MAVKAEQYQRSLRIALLTPYDGGNLGDSAIQQAVIANLRRYDPNVQLCGITLDPAKIMWKTYVSVLIFLLRPDSTYNSDPNGQCVSTFIGIAKRG